MKSLNDQKNDRIQINSINEAKWVEHSKQLSEIKTTTRKENVRCLNDIDSTELTEAVKASKNRKTIGIDVGTLKIWRTHIRLRHLHNKFWKNRIIPDHWRRAKVISLFKKADQKILQDYRGIGLLDTAYKIYTRILNNRLETIAGGLLDKEEMENINGRLTIDCREYFQYNKL